MLYNTYIYERYKTLKESKKEFDNNDLSKIFEYYSAIKLKELYNKDFYEYNDIHPEFKELHQMSKNDSGIDLCDLENSIVQCKLRKNNLTWNECATFFASQNIYDEKYNDSIIKWKNLIIARNEDSKLSSNLKQQNKRFYDITFSKEEMLKYCEDLLLNFKPVKVIKEKIILRDYQNEAIDIIKNNKNVIISIPTGCGKNLIIIFSMDENKKYLVLVPRIILMEQFKNEIIDKRPEFKKNIQCIGDGKNIYNHEKLITICVYNSVHVVKDKIFDKIYIDEAHHINRPEIYKNEEDEIMDEIKDDNNEFKEGFDDEDFNEDEDENDIENIEEYETEDVEDELKDIKNYTDIIRSFKNQENNVYLSATIDKEENFKYFNKDIREMINLKYLCDYTINIPIFSNDPSNKNVCEYLIKNYRNVIIYCGLRAEGKKINDLMNVLQNGICYYIDCFTKKKKRNEILNKYKNGDIAFLVNVKILVEGFDAPITKGVCFMHMPSDKTTLIQIIGRALRLHKDKNISNVILPFNDNNDEKTICKFLNVMATNDSRIKESYKSKKLGGYVNIVKTEEDDVNENVNVKYECVYDSLGICRNREEVWMNNLNEVKKYMDEHNKRPNDNKFLLTWIDKNIRYYKYNLSFMKNEYIYKIWKEFVESSKYAKYFCSNIKKWYKNLEELKKYILEHKKLPCVKLKLGKWCSAQKKNYYISAWLMKNKQIYDSWKNFIEDDNYNEYMLSYDEKWILKFNDLKIFLDKNKKRPTNKTNSKLFCWTQHQLHDFKNKLFLMKNEKIYNIFDEFINKSEYKELFNNLTPEENWILTFKKYKKFIIDNNNTPTRKSDKFLHGWITKNTKYFKNKLFLMKNEKIYNIFDEFINKSEYSKFFNK